MPSEKIGLKMPRVLWKHRGAAFLFLCVLAGILSYPLRLSQDFYADYVVIAFFMLALIDFDFSFLAFLFLTQAFLGESDKPYLYLIDFLILILLVIGWFRIYRSKIKIDFHAWWIVLPFKTGLLNGCFSINSFTIVLVLSVDALSTTRISILCISYFKSRQFSNFSLIVFSSL